MTCVREKHFGPDSGDFSLYFLAQLAPGTECPESNVDSNYISTMFPQVLELTHNHGTENDENFKYHNGNDENLALDPPMRRGFGHVGFLCNDLAAACQTLDDAGVPFKKRPSEGAMRNLAFVYDPDGYAVEIIQDHGTTI